MPFVFPHAFMPPVAVAGFAPPPQVTLAATIDIMQGSQKNPSIECIAKQAKLNNEVYRKKVEIVKLDNTKDNVDLMKNAMHWKDHCGFDPTRDHPWRDAKHV